MLELKALRFQRGNQNAYNFNVRLKPGERIAIMGASGSGKSTLLDLIAGFEIPTDGALVFDDVNLLEMPIAERPVTLLSQHDNLLPHLNVFENTALGLSLKAKLNESETSAITKAIAEVGLAGFEQRLPSELSGGQQQRCALARSLLRDKPVLLLDEPFSALDQDLRAEMAALVNRIVASRNLCLIVVTHDHNDAALLAERVLTIKSGQLQ